MASMAVHKICGRWRKTVSVATAVIFGGLPFRDYEIKHGKVKKWMTVPGAMPKRVCRRTVWIVTNRKETGYGDEYDA